MWDFRPFQALFSTFPAWGSAARRAEGMGSLGVVLGKDAVVVSCGQAAELHHAALSLPLIRRTGGENRMKESLWAAIRTGGSLPGTIRGKTDSACSKLM